MLLGHIIETLATTSTTTLLNFENDLKSDIVNFVAKKEVMAVVGAFNFEIVSLSFHSGSYFLFNDQVNDL